MLLKNMVKADLFRELINLSGRHVPPLEHTLFLSFPL